jgi:FG-GAP-like repeat/Bacterial Ig-like domain (group 3)/FG-GAP repeat
MSRTASVPTAFSCIPVCVAIAAMFALTLGAAGVASAQGFPLGVRVDFPTGDAIATTLVDLNGDHIPDLVTANLTGASMSVMLGTGGGAFGVRTDFAVPAEPRHFSVGDVNGDGKPDIVTANLTGGTISVLLGNGSGGFAAHADFAAGLNSYDVALADLNMDGKLDVVVSISGGNAVSVLIGNGDGTFGPPTSYPVGLSPHCLALGDMNGDGIPDIVVENHGSGSVSVLLGNGTGGFGTAANFATDAGPTGLALTDLNNDGTLDVVTCNDIGLDVSVLLGDGSGGLGTSTNVALSAHGFGVAVGDVDGDGKPDIACALGAPANVVSVLSGDGSGGFGAPTNFPVGNGPSALSIGDANGDGRPDIVVADLSGSTVSLLLAAPIMGEETRLSGGGLATAMGDLNGDGLADIAAATGGNNVLVYLASPSGFGAPTSYTTGSGSSGVAFADLDGDGKPDMMVTNQNDATISTFGNLGAGTFGLRTTSATRSFPTAIVWGQFNSGTGPVVVNELSNSVSILQSNGTGGLLDYIYGLEYPTAPLPLLVAVGDVDGDGYTDLVTSNNNSVSISNHVLVLPSTTTTFYPPYVGPFSVALADLNGDGKPDLVVMTHSNCVLVYLNNGTGFGATPAAYALPSFPEAAGVFPVSIGDLNGDGRLDIAVATRIDSSSYVTSHVNEFFGDGSGGFGPCVSTFMPAGDVAMGDVNGDGRLDLASGGNSVLLSPSPTRCVLAAATGSMTAGSTIALTATIQPTRIVPASSSVGSVRFFDGTTLLGASPVSWVSQGASPTLYKGTATLTPTLNRPGARSLSAIYGGDGRRAGSIAPSITELVQPLPLAVESGRTVSFGLARMPNPAIGGRLQVAFALPTDASATLELFDLHGRRLARRDVGSLGAGDHSVNFGTDRPLASGVYFVRLTQGGNVATARRITLQ